MKGHATRAVLIALGNKIEVATQSFAFLILFADSFACEYEKPMQLGQTLRRINTALSDPNHKPV